MQFKTLGVFLAAVRRRGVHGQEHLQLDFQYGVDDAVFFGHGTWFAPAGSRDDRQALSQRRIGDLLVESRRVVKEKVAR